MRSIVFALVLGLFITNSACGGADINEDPSAGTADKSAGSAESVEPAAEVHPEITKGPGLPCSTTVAPGAQVCCQGYVKCANDMCVSRGGNCSW